MGNGLDYEFGSPETKVLFLRLLLTDGVTLQMSFNFLLSLRLCDYKVEQVILASLNIWIIASTPVGQVNEWRNISIKHLANSTGAKKLIIIAFVFIVAQI